MNACVGTGSLLMLHSIFLMNSIVIFFLLVSSKKKLSPNCSRNCTLVGIESKDRLINHLLRIETREEKGTFWKNISGFTLIIDQRNWRNAKVSYMRRGRWRNYCNNSWQGVSFSIPLHGVYAPTNYTFYSTALFIIHLFLQLLQTVQFLHCSYALYLQGAV